MLLVGIMANKKDVQEFRKKISNDIKIFDITNKNIKNYKNIKFDDIVINTDIKENEETYKSMNELLRSTKYLIVNSDLEIISKINIEKPIKLITFGFNSKATITISSVMEEKIIICIQRNITKDNNEIIEEQEMKIDCKNSKKTYNEIIAFLIKKVHNL